MSEMIRVGMADYKLCAPPDKISTLGLGSCMGVVIYDTKTKFRLQRLAAWFIICFRTAQRLLIIKTE